MSCRTQVMGGHIALCNHCHEKTYSYHSCKNRFCPACGYDEGMLWFERQQARFLPTHYFHLTFTLHPALRNILRSNQKLLYDTMFSSVATTLKQTAAAEKSIAGSAIGFMCVLHTWTRRLMYHPHIHCLVTGGGYCLADNQWVPSQTKFLFPAPALSKQFRAIFIKRARAALPHIDFPPNIWDKDWVVDIRPVSTGKNYVLAYLSRYVKRPPLVNSHIKGLCDNHIVITYTDYESGTQVTMKLKPFELLRRFLQHILPKGFTRVRYFGLLAPSCKLTLIMAHVAITNQCIQKNRGLPVPSQELPKQTSPIPHRCPHCKIGILSIVERLPRISRGPPIWH